MKRWIRAIGVVAILTSGSAFAADLAPAPPPVAPAFTWTGFYIGLNGGGAWSDEGFALSAPPFTTPPDVFGVCAAPAGGVLPAPTAPNPFHLSAACSSSGSFLGGGQIGYNWQSGAWLYGVEADGDWQHLVETSFTRFGANATAGAPFGSVVDDTGYLRAEQNGLGTLRVRAGYTVGNWLLYATGGLAVGGVNHSLVEVLSPGNTCVTPFSGTTCQAVTASTTKVGWTVGAGTEVKLANNWSIGAEYLYVDLGTSNLTIPSQGACTVLNYFCNATSASFRDREQIVRLKLNYFFDAPPAPAVAAPY